MSGIFHTKYRTKFGIIAQPHHTKMSRILQTKYRTKIGIIAQTSSNKNVQNFPYKISDKNWNNRPNLIKQKCPEFSIQNIGQKLE
jgi:hypothetical protein